MKTRLIAFTGTMGSGKSTAINYLNLIAEASGKTAHNEKFAQTLYDIQESVYDHIKNVYQRPADFVKDRKLLQWIGTEWGRDTISKTLWVDIWKDNVKYALENYTNRIVTCDDVRFDNEGETVKSMGGVIIRLKTNRGQERITTANGIAVHASESGINDKYVDFTVENNGTIEEFKSSLLAVYKELGLWA